MSGLHRWKGNDGWSWSAGDGRSRRRLGGWRVGSVSSHHQLGRRGLWQTRQAGCRHRISWLCQQDKMETTTWAEPDKLGFWRFESKAIRGHPSFDVFDAWNHPNHQRGGIVLSDGTIDLSLIGRTEHFWSSVKCRIFVRKCGKLYIGANSSSLVSTSITLRVHDWLLNNVFTSTHLNLRPSLSSTQV